jgi:uncharacterized phiE125 gp8 family phage protein
LGNYELITPPAAEPIELAEAKAHARVESDAEDGLFGRLIPAARGYVERFCGLALITQTWRATFDAWTPRGLKLRPHQVQTIDAVKVWDGAALTVQDLGGFQLVRSRPARLVSATGVDPAQPTRAYAGIEVEFTAGFGAIPSDVPDELKQAMLLLIGHWYENREPTALNQNLSVVGDIKFTIDHLLVPHRGMALG